MRDVPYWWRRRGWLAWLLWPLSLLFAAVVALRRWFYQRGVLASYRAPVCVVVVGNITVGGNGKSPLVVALARGLTARGVACAVVSRGYGGALKTVAEVCADTTAQQVGDEPLMIAQQTGVPVFVGAKRAQAVQAALAVYPETRLIISDDGLQHYALARDKEWVAVAPDWVFGNGWLLPAGPLRERLSRLRSVDAVLCTQAIDLPDNIRQIRLSARSAGARPLSGGAAVALSDLAQERPLYLLSAIARPQRLLASIAAQGVTLADYRFFPDHAPLPDAVAGFAEAGYVLMTAKDAVKAQAWSAQLRARVFVLDYELVLPEALFDEIEEQI